MAHKFKIGDRVRVLNHVRSAAFNGATGILLTDRLDSDGELKIQLDDTSADGGLCYARPQSMARLGTFEALQIDDVIERAGRENTVLGVVGNAILLADADGDGLGVCSARELEREGWTIKGQDDGTVELTLEEIAELKGVPVEKIRIKESE